MRRALLAGTACALLLARGASAQDAAPELECLIEPWERVTLSAPIEGRVDEMLVDRGDPVKRGQVIARLEASVERRTIDVHKARAAAEGPLPRFEAQLELAERELARQNALESKEIASERERDEAESARRVAEALRQEAQEERAVARLEHARARAIYELRTIRTPIDGVVVRRILSAGEYADPPQLVEIARVDPLRVEVFAPHELFDALRPGMTARVSAEGGRGPFEAKVDIVDPVIDPASGTFGVRLELANPGGRIPAGLACRARFELESATGD